MRWLALLFIPVAGIASADMLDDYVALSTGTFSSAAQARQDQRYDAVTWHIAEIWEDRDDNARWLYTESWMDDGEKPYMQRVSKLSVTDDGEILSERFRLPDSADVTGAYEDPSRFDTVSTDDLIVVTGCNGIIVRTGKARFEGSTTGRRCVSRYKGASYAVSQSVVTNTGMTNWDRGFTDAGELVWGPAAGGYRFERSDLDNACNQPVRMLVYGEIHDRDKFLAYVRAIGQSGLYEATGGYYEGITPPLAVFEGDPPPSRGVVISRFPCLEAAKDFWYSDKYESIRPLREGIAEFEVLILPAPPLPDWLGQ